MAEGGIKRFFKAGATNVFRNYIVCGVTLPVYDLCVNSLNDRYWFKNLLSKIIIMSF